MFCPSCGVEEKHNNQFCRACGSNLSLIRATLEAPDRITASAINARDEIGRAFAQKIREADSTSKLNKVVNEVLPQIEKFLESPEERRLRRMRTGTIISSIGLGISLIFLLMLSTGAQTIFMVGIGLLIFFIGLGCIVNGLIFTLPKKQINDYSDEGAKQKELDLAAPKTSELKLPEAKQIFGSVVEETTRQLKENQPVIRD